MLEIHPVTDPKEAEEYITARQLPEGTALLRAYESDEVTGNAAVTVDGVGEDALLTLHTLEYADDFTGELLVRAVISYAFNRAVPTVSAPADLQNALLDKIGFRKEGKNLSIATKNVVHFCQK